MGTLCVCGMQVVPTTPITSLVPSWLLTSQAVHRRITPVLTISAHRINYVICGLCAYTYCTLVPMRMCISLVLTVSASAQKYISLLSVGMFLQLCGSQLSCRISE